MKPISRRSHWFVWLWPAVASGLAGCGPPDVQRAVDPPTAIESQPALETPQEPLDVQVRDLVASLEEDHAVAPDSATVQVPLCVMLVELGHDALPYIEAELEGSTVRPMLEQVMESIPRKGEGCSCRFCAE